MTLDFETAKHVDLDDRFPIADTKNFNYPYYRGLDYLTNLPTDKPRMIKSHFNYAFLPDDIQKRHKGRVSIRLTLPISDDWTSYQYHLGQLTSILGASGPGVISVIYVIFR